MAELLLTYGANQTAKDQNGKLPHDLSVSTGFTVAIPTLWTRNCMVQSEDDMKRGQENVKKELLEQISNFETSGFIFLLDSINGYPALPKGSHSAIFKLNGRTSDDVLNRDYYGEESSATISTESLLSSLENDAVNWISPNFPSRTSSLLEDNRNTISLSNQSLSNIFTSKRCCVRFTFMNHKDALKIICQTFEFLTSEDLCNAVPVCCDWSRLDIIATESWQNLWRNLLIKDFPGENTSIDDSKTTKLTCNFRLRYAQMYCEQKKMSTKLDRSVLLGNHHKNEWDYGGQDESHYRIRQNTDLKRISTEYTFYVTGRASNEEKPAGYRPRSSFVKNSDMLYDWDSDSSQENRHHYGYQSGGYSTGSDYGDGYSSGEDPAFTQQEKEKRYQRRVSRKSDDTNNSKSPDRVVLFSEQAEFTHNIQQVDAVKHRFNLHSNDLSWSDRTKIPTKLLRLSFDLKTAIKLPVQAVRAPPQGGAQNLWQNSNPRRRIHEPYTYPQTRIDFELSVVRNSDGAVAHLFEWSPRFGHDNQSISSSEVKTTCLDRARNIFSFKEDNADSVRAHMHPALSGDEIESGTHETVFVKMVDGYKRGNDDYYYNREHGVRTYYLNEGDIFSTLLNNADWIK